MPERSKPTARTIHLALATLLTLPAAGCLTSSASDVETEAPPAAEEPVERTPDELLETLEKTQAKAEEIAKALASCSSEVAERRLREQVDLGLRTADELFGHADAQQRHTEAVRPAKATLLYLGMRYRWDGFQQRIAALHKQLMAEEPTSPLTAVVEAMLLERLCLDPQAEFGQVMASLEEHAKRFPDQPTGLAMYRLYADQLKKQRRMEELKRCCLTALAAYGNRPQSHSFRQSLDGIETKLRQERVKLARLERIRSRLAGHRTGYFLIYAHPPKVAFMSRVDYHVALGLEGTANYVDSLDEDWVWEVIRRFPDTPDGNQQAFALRKELLDKNTITMFGS